MPTEKLAKQEACQLFIEQEIEEGLEKGQTPYAIGKEVAIWIEKLFQAKVKPKTIMERARRQKLSTFVDTDITHSSDTENEEKPTETVRTDKGLFEKGTAPGPGRPPKFLVKQEQFRTSFTGENEWYTPLQYIDAARKVMGEIDLDPATSEFGQKRIQAKSHFTQKENGLVLPWHGKIWLNPPYSQPLISQFIEKAINEHEQKQITELIALTHNHTDTQWFHSLESISSFLCFTKGRIKYEKEDGTIAAPTQGATFFYIGSHSHRFREVFQAFGFIR